MDKNEFAFTREGAWGRSLGEGALGEELGEGHWGSRSGGSG